MAQLDYTDTMLLNVKLQNRLYKMLRVLCILLFCAVPSFAELTQESLDDLWLKHLRHQEELGRSIDGELENYFVLKLSENISDKDVRSNLSLLLRKRGAALYLKSLEALTFLLAGQESPEYNAFLEEEAQRAFFIKPEELDEEKKQFLKDELYALGVFINAGRLEEAEERSLSVIKEVGLSEELLDFLLKSFDTSQRRGLVLGLHFLRSIHVDAVLEAQIQLIDALSALGQFSFAEKYIEAELIKHPESLELLRSQVKLAEASGDLQKLVKTTRVWITKDSANYSAWTKYGSALRQTGEFGFAAGALSKAARMIEKPIEAEKELALLAVAENKTNKLTDHLDTLQQIMGIGDFYTFLKDPAFADYQELVSSYELDVEGL